MIASGSCGCMLLCDYNVENIGIKRTLIKVTVVLAKACMGREE